MDIRVLQVEFDNSVSHTVSFRLLISESGGSTWDVGGARSYNMVLNLCRIEGIKPEECVPALGLHACFDSLIR